MSKFISQKQKLIKLAGSEETGITDPRTGLKIYVTTTVRKKYREYFSESKALEHGRDIYSDLRNRELNEIIAQDFAASADGVRHYFLANTSDITSKKRQWIEVRQVHSPRPFIFFLALVGSGYVNIIGTTTKFNKPRKPRILPPEAFR